MFEPRHSRPCPKGVEGIWNVFVTKGDCGPYKLLDGFNMHCRETNSVLAINCVHVTGKIDSWD